MRPRKRPRRDAEEAQKAAEDAKKKADEKAKADAAAAAAAAAREKEEKDRADAEKKRADEAEQKVVQANARYALDGMRPVLGRKDGDSDVMRIFSGESHTDPAEEVMVTPRHGMTALITPKPRWGYSTAERSSASGWTVTKHTHSGHVHDDVLVVYDNRGGPVSIPLVQEFDDGVSDDAISETRDPFHDGTPATAGTVISSGDLTKITVAANNVDYAAVIRSASFPSTDGTNKIFPDNYDSTPNAGGNAFDMVRISGTFMGASGHFECGRTDTSACIIGRRGNRYTIESGLWTFETTDRANARIDDRSYAYFGWWRREHRENDTYSYLPFVGIAPDAETGGDKPLAYSVKEASSAAFNNLTGSATYTGPAIGQYAIYQPLNGESGTGEFTADVELTANFGTDNTAGTVGGTVTNFSNDSSWSLTLNAATMPTGTVEYGTDAENNGNWVNWTIGSHTSDVRGRWTAKFYSESNFVGQVPDGVVGTFTAAYDEDINTTEDFDDIVGTIVGAFGAEKSP